MDLFTLSASLGLNITNFTNGINLARRLLLDFANAVVDFGRDVIETGMGFDKQMSAVQAVMGLTENTAENMATMNELREFALEQARDSIFTSEEAATAYYYMGMAGWSAEQAIAGLPGVMALAAASGEDLKMTSDMVTDSLTAFGLGAGQASHFADVLAVTATNANTDVARMQQTFRNLAPIAGALGYSIEDVALSVGLIANAGIKGTQAGTALRNIFTRIATNAGATSKTLGALQVVTDELGVSFYTAEGRARPWGEILMEVREAWRKLSPDEVDKVTTAFGKFFAESQSADDVMAEFADDLDTWTAAWNGLTTELEREEFVSDLESQFATLGVSMRDSNGNLREFSEVAKDARVVLGGLTDEEQIYYGKQIGSLRGISGWLALMTASNEDVRQLTDAITNADGAAQAMADTRLDNLWGDIARFNAELDVLKIALYDDVKSPLRDVVQYATGAFKNVTDAIEKDGLLGGIRQLGTEIKNFGEEYKDEIKALGESIAPIIEVLVTSITPALVGSAVTLGAAFGKGLVEGIVDNLPRWALGMLGIQEGESAPSPEMYESSLKGIVTEMEEPDVKNYGGVEIPVDVIANIDLEQLKSNIEFAMSHGGVDIEIGDGLIIGVDAAQRLADDIAEASPGSAVAADIGDALSGVDTAGLESSVSSVGAPAGNKIAADIGTALSGKSYSINVKANVTGLPTGATGVDVHARSMYGGTILRGATLFGYNAKGQPMIGGGEGPEAVVGTHSLSRMIQESVANAMAGFVDRLSEISGSGVQNLQVVLDTGTLVGAIAPTMNRELGSISDWRRGNRA